MGNDGQDSSTVERTTTRPAGEGNDFSLPVRAPTQCSATVATTGSRAAQARTSPGDHSAPFFDDPAEVAPGNDFFIGQNGENDYDAEGGDDVMAQNAFVDRNGARLRLGIPPVRHGRCR
jgi:hypothetical protein